MARFDVYVDPQGDGYLLDCQTDLLSYLNTRLVVPLLRPDAAPSVAAARLNPTFTVEGEDVIMFTQFAAAIPTRELREPVGSLADHHAAIITAFDMLLTGY